MARVLVDGEEHGTFTSHVDTEQNKPAQVIAYQVTDLAEGEHTVVVEALGEAAPGGEGTVVSLDRKSTRLNSSHVAISYAVFCLKKNKPNHRASSAKSSD